MRIRINALTYSLLVAVVWTALYNSGLWAFLSGLPWQSGTGQAFFLFTFFFFMVGALTFLLSLISFRWLLKPLVVVLTLTNASASYFMQKYSIVFDPGMIRNIVETDLREALGLLTWGWALYVLALGVLPAVLLALVPIQWRDWKRQWLWRLGGVATGLALIAGVAAVAYQEYASVFRNHREVRYYILPTSYSYYLVRHFQKQHQAQKAPFKVLDPSPELRADMKKPKKRPLMLVVLGETARAMNFSLNGYTRQTNPELAKIPDLINFPEATSCGTDTATSVPCMFTYDSRASYDIDRARNQDNVLDILQRAGYEVIWRDNNSGCKDMCDRVEIQAKDLWRDAALCQGEHCFDEALLNRLKEVVSGSGRGVVVVLHMEGSHGPAYYERVPERFRRFTPDCRTAQLQDCSAEEIRNAYDNTILYTDFVLASAIRVLKALEPDVAPGLLYASDHGESLGENGLYLHGMPRMLAPDTQTRVPMLMWVSEALSAETGLDQDCLRARANQPVSHDNWSHTLTGLLGVQTRLYDAALDLTASCRHSTARRGLAGGGLSVAPDSGT